MLYLIATPIGNLEDISLRAINTLKEVDCVLAEDTRKSGYLLKNFNIEKPLESLFEHNETRRLNQVISRLKAGENMALISSAGTPTISDPGFKLLRACRNENIPVTAIPGSCSIINALSLSSLPRDKFVFLGYLPRKSGARKKTLLEFAGKETALVFLESPFRLEKTLCDINEIFPNARLTIAREMTKKFEEIWEGAISQALTKFENNSAKGEFVIVLSEKLE